jgi:hypothetical protein
VKGSEGEQQVADEHGRDEVTSDLVAHPAREGERADGDSRAIGRQWQWFQGGNRQEQDGAMTKAGHLRPS